MPSSQVLSNRLVPACRRIALAPLVLAAALTSAAAQPACPMPERPACTLAKGPFARDLDYEECRLATIRFKGGMEAAAACHRAAGRASEGQAADDEIERAVLQLNRRARGEAD